MSEHLRVAILCNGTVFKHWEAECLRQVLAVKGVELVVLIVHDKAPQPDRKPAFKHALYRWLKRERLRAHALAPVDMGSELSGIPHLFCQPVGPTIEQRFQPKDLEEVRKYAPDVLLRFGFGILAGDILTVATHGIWGYHHGDEEKYRGRPAAFWEIIHGDPITGVTLQRLTEKVDAGKILRKGWFRTIPHSWSANLDNVLAGSTAWMALQCQEILRGNKVAAEGLDSDADVPLNKAPDNWVVLGYLLKHGSVREERRHAIAAERDEWNIGVLYQPIAALLEAKPSLNVRWLPAPGPGQQRITPFGYMADGQLNVLYGKFNTVSRKGEISRVRPKRDNALKRSRTMLANEHVLSYPYLLRHKERLFVIPESSVGRVDLYEVTPDNEGMRFVRTLLNEPLCAPTVFEFDGRWWLMGTRAPWEDVALFAYHAPALEGPYIPHGMNPLKMDVRSARPAGTPFVHQGQLYRPARDNSITHGWRVALMRVLELSPSGFREELVRTIGPLKGSAWSKGTGTLSAVGDLTLVDGKRPMPRRPNGSSAKLRVGPGRRSATSKPTDEDDDDED